MTVPDSGKIRDYGLLLCGAIVVLALVYLAGTSGPAPTAWRAYALAQEQVVVFKELQIQELTAQCQEQLQQLQVRLETELARQEEEGQ